MPSENSPFILLWRRGKEGDLDSFPRQWSHSFSVRAFGLVLRFIGGCARSPGGSLWHDRFDLTFTALGRQGRRLFHKERLEPGADPHSWRGADYDRDHERPAAIFRRGSGVGGYRPHRRRRRRLARLSVRFGTYLSRHPPRDKERVRAQG